MTKVSHFKSSIKKQRKYQRKERMPIGSFGDVVGKSVCEFSSRSHHLDGARGDAMERFLFSSSSSSSSFSTRDAKKAFSSTTTPTNTETKEERSGKKTRRENSSIPAKVDVAIVGGGLVGVAFARALRMSAKTKHLSVAVLDGNPRAFSKRDKKEEEDKQQQQQENPYKPKARVSADPESIDHRAPGCGGVWTQIEDQLEERV